MKPETRGKKPKFSLNYRDERMRELVQETDHATLASWAADCAERVLHYFEEIYPDDTRPGEALKTLRAWIRTGIFHMADIRGASLAAHTAARETGEDSPARSAARAAGQAVATAHVRTHSLAAANYALQAAWRASVPSTAGDAVTKERDWQYRHLIALKEKSAGEK